MMENVNELIDLKPIKRDIYICPVCHSEFEFECEAKHCAEMHVKNTLSVKFDRFSLGKYFPSGLWLLNDNGVVEYYVKADTPSKIKPWYGKNNIKF